MAAVVEDESVGERCDGGGGEHKGFGRGRHCGVWRTDDVQ